MPRCGSSSKSGRPGPPGVGCGKPIREEAIEALGRKWHWKCFTCDVSATILSFDNHSHRSSFIVV
jgi:hydroxyacyl-ACP dehydratase HTD2-like protein with hotdog domain